MTDAVLVALISSAATLLAVYLKLKLDKDKNKKIIKETRILLEDLNAKKATIILKEDDTDFDFTSNSSIDKLMESFRFDLGDLGVFEISFENPSSILEKDRKKIENYINFLKRNLS